MDILVLMETGSILEVLGTFRVKGLLGAIQPASALGNYGPYQTWLVLLVPGPRSHPHGHPQCAATWSGSLVAVVHQKIPCGASALTVTKGVQFHFFPHSRNPACSRAPSLILLPPQLIGETGQKAR